MLSDAELEGLRRWAQERNDGKTHSLETRGNCVYCSVLTLLDDLAEANRLLDALVKECNPWWLEWDVGEGSPKLGSVVCRFCGSDEPDHGDSCTYAIAKARPIEAGAADAR